MDSHVLSKASYRLPALADIAVLRFNTRGTTSPRGTSEGTFDEGPAERYDVAAAIEYAEFHDLPHRWLLGWSFGTDLALMHGCDPAVEGAILLSPPLRYGHRGDLRGLGRVRQAAAWRWCRSSTTTCARPRRAQRFARVAQAEVVGGRGRPAPVGGGDVRPPGAGRDRRRGSRRTAGRCRRTWDGPSRMRRTRPATTEAALVLAGRHARVSGQNDHWPAEGAQAALGGTSTSL